MGKFVLQLPVISSNMKDITGPKMVATMAEYGGMGILHRFTREDIVDDHGIADFEESKNLCTELWRHSGLVNMDQDPTDLFGVSVGVQESDKERFDKLYEAGAKIFCVDVAHGHHVLVKKMISWIRGKCFNTVCIIAGNVATPQGARDLVEWGADIVKIGIGPGDVCMTRKNTGVGVPQLYALKEIRNTCPNIVMIADGGIKSTGDIAKALKYANAVMVGSFIAGTSETPGHVYENPEGQYYKVYGGSASGERKVQNGQHHKHVEGIVKMVPFRGKAKFILRKIKENLQSAFSYSGAMTLPEFQNKAILKEISGGAKQESKL
jgi:IMP dehydrogenase